MTARTSSAEPRERPILFSAAMVRAILAGRKTVTRRICKPQWPAALTTSGYWGAGVAREGARDPYTRERVRSDAYHVHTRLADGRDAHIYCPFGKPGDRLWGRETFWHRNYFVHDDGEWQFGEYIEGSTHSERGTSRADDVRYVATDDKPVAVDPHDERWEKRPAIFMPRWASRIELAVMSVRVERLQAITAKDIRAEGIDARVVAELLGRAQIDDTPLSDLWRVGWDAINGARAPYASNPWVWRVAFDPVTRSAGEPRAREDA